MATAPQTQELLENLDEKLEQLKEAVQALTEAAGRVTPPPTEAPESSTPEKR